MRFIDLPKTHMEDTFLTFIIGSSMHRHFGVLQLELDTYLLHRLESLDTSAVQLQLLLDETTAETTTNNEQRDERIASK